MPVFVTNTYFDCIESATQKAYALGVGLNIKTIIFCEDKLTLSIEKSLVKKAGGAFGTEVLSFGRYATRKILNRKTLSKEGASMVVKKILGLRNNELKTLSSLGASPALATKTAELIAQLKSAKVSYKSINGALKECGESLYPKLKDISLIYEDYENFLKEKDLTDSNNYLEDLLEVLLKDEDLPNTNIIIAGYSSVTKQSCEVMKILYERAKTCNFFAVSGDNEDLYTQEFLNFVVKFTKEQPIYIPSTQNGLSKSISNRIFKAERFEEVGLYSDKIHIFEAKNIMDEVDFTASSIKKIIMERGIKYSDIAVGVGNLSDYSLTIKRKFADYDIPFFTDEKKTLSFHPLSRLIKSLIKISVRKNDIAEIKKIIGNSLFISEKAIADKFIKLLTENSVTVSSFYKEPPINVDSPDNIYIQAKWTILADFINSFPKKATALNYVEIIKKFLSKCKISYISEEDESVKILAEKLEKAGSKEERSYLESGTEKFFGILDEIAEILSNDLLTGDEFNKILSSGAEACEISLIPEYLDCVYVSELKNCRFKNYDYLFAVGLSGDIPSVKADTALLLDSEISGLEALSVSIEPKIRVVNRREKEACAIALCSFDKELFISYSLLSPSGASVTKSEIVDYILKIFSDEKNKLTAVTRQTLKEKGLDGEYDYMSLRPALFSLAKDANRAKSTGEKLGKSSSFYNALKTYEGGKYLPVADGLIGKVYSEDLFYLNIPHENYFNKGEVSASTIECYYSCPYKCFLKYGVGIRDTVSAEVGSNDVGNIMHTVAEELFKIIENIKSEEQVLEKTEEIIEKELCKKEYARFLKRADNAYSIELLKEEAKKVSLRLYKEYINSEFKTVGQEIWFSDWSNTRYKSYKLPTKRGSFKLFGKVDRIDKYKNYVRIIDYKTGDAKKKTDNKMFYTGQNLQLYLYMNAFSVDGDKPAGAYYYAVNDNFSKEDESPITMHGKTLSDKEILFATDKNLETTGKSEVIDVKINTYKTTGEKTEGSIAEERTLTGFMEYAKQMASGAINGVLDGVAVPSPYEKGCEYCEFGALCGFDEEAGFKEREVPSISDEVIVEAVEKKEPKEED